jgi:transposase
MKSSSSKQIRSERRRRNVLRNPSRFGVDLGDRSSRYCMLSGEGEILREDQVPTTKAGMTATFGSLGRARIAIEVGTHSP